MRSVRLCKRSFKRSLCDISDTLIFFFFLSSQFALEIELYTGWSIRLEIIFSFLLLEGRIIT